MEVCDSQPLKDRVHCLVGKCTSRSESNATSKRGGHQPTQFPAVELFFRWDRRWLSGLSGLSWLNGRSDRRRGQWGLIGLGARAGFVVGVVRGVGLLEGLLLGRH